jgi:hypothetical protein
MTGGAVGLGRAVRARTVVVIVPLVVGLAVSGAVGARMLLAEPPEPELAAAQATCWDGSPRSEAAVCAPPTGVRGLHWVFPSFKPLADDCHDVRARDPEVRRPTAWACEFEMSGSPVTITYLELRSVAGGRRAFDEEYAGAERRTVAAADGTRLRHEWRRELPNDDGVVVTVMYVGHPYAVQVTAERRALREAALTSTVQFRAPELLR